MRARIYQIESLSSAESTVCCFFFFCPLRRSRWWCNAYASFAVCVHQTVTHTNKPFFTAHWSYSQVLAAAGMGLSLSPSLFPAFFNQKTTGGLSSPQSSPSFFSLFVFGYTQVCFLCVCVSWLCTCVCVFFQSRLARIQWVPALFYWQQSQRPLPNGVVPRRSLGRRRMRNVNAFA